MQTDPQAARYLRAVHRTAFELAVPNHFGLNVGGFWLTMDQMLELRGFPEYYPPNETALVAQAVNAYLQAQLKELYPAARR